MKINWWIVGGVGGVLYAGWAFVFLKYVMQKTFNEEFQVVKNLSEKDKKKYFMYVRSECKYLESRRLSMTICGLTIVPLKWILFFFAIIC